MRENCQSVTTLGEWVNLSESYVELLQLLPDLLGLRNVARWASRFLLHRENNGAWVRRVNGPGKGLETREDFERWKALVYMKKEQEAWENFIPSPFVQS